MSVITISRSLCSGGKQIAQKVARRLDHDTISEEIISAAAFEHRVTENRLARAIHDKPSVLDRFTARKEQDLACIHDALLSRVKEGKVVYHGLAGHFLLKDFPNVLKIRITACFEHRVAALRRQNEMTAGEAHLSLMKEDEARRMWSIKHYGIDQTNVGLYDVVLNMDTIGEPDAIDIICRLAATDQFRSSAKTTKAIEDAALASAVRVSLMGLTSTVEARARDGVVTIKTHCSPLRRDVVVAEMKRRARSVSGVKEVDVETLLMPLLHE